MKLQTLKSFEVLNNQAINIINGGNGSARPSRKYDSNACKDNPGKCCIIDYVSKKLKELIN